MDFIFYSWFIKGKQFSLEEIQSDWKLQILVGTLTCDPKS